MIAISAFSSEPRGRPASMRDAWQSSGTISLTESAAVCLPGLGGGSQHVCHRPPSACYRALFSRILCVLLALLITVTSPATARSDDPPRQLTFDGRLKRDPVFVNQGREIIYAVLNGKPRLVLYRLRLSDGHTERLHPDSPLPEFRPVYSRDEATFAYLQMTGNDRLTVQVRRVGMPQPLIVKPPAAVIWHAALTPDGQNLLYASSGQLRIYPLSGGKERTLTQTEGRNNWPSVSQWPSGRLRLKSTWQL